MDAAGVQIASHSATHPILTNVTYEQLRAELCESKTRIETMIDRAVDFFCYPNGSYDQRISLGVSKAGYRGAVTVDDGLNETGSDTFRLKRVHTQNTFARFIQCTSGFEQFKNRLVHAGREAAAI
jgi:peptidoglycan/xylan/chitin deacetylase (PgdA/CDA1 family)